MSINVELNMKEINVEVCKNVFKMLERRRLIDNYQSVFDKVFNDINNRFKILFFD